MPKPVKVLFVCLGNICRSPTAEGLFTALVARRCLTEALEIDSAGTGAWHAGEPPDKRMTAAAKRLGYELRGQARAVVPGDYEHFDHILAMDRDNLDTLLAECPAEYKGKVRLFRDYDPDDPGASVPDPYYGGQSGFDIVVEMVERTCEHFLDALELDA